MDKSSNAYKTAKRKADAKFKEKTGAYKSMFIVREYKKLGGKFTGSKPKDKGLSRWVKEKWQRPGGKPCGRNEKEVKQGKKKSICRPTRKVTSKTPKTAKELGSKEMARRVRKKQRAPNKTVTKSK